MAKNIFRFEKLFHFCEILTFCANLLIFISLFATQRHLPAESTRLQQIIDRFNDTDSPNRDDYRIEAH
jgi:hypothetical protein